MSDEIDGTNVAEFFTHENEGNEARSVDWFQKMTGEPKPEKVVITEELETDSAPVVESEQDLAEEPAPDGEGEPADADAEPDDPTDEPAPEAQTSDDLLHAQRRAELLGRQLAQAQWQLQQTALAQRAVDPEPPRWHQMSPAQQEQLQREAAEIGAEPFELLTERRAEWKARQVLAERDQQLSEAYAQQRQEAFQQAALRVIEHTSTYGEYADHISAEFDSYPEFFEVARQMEPSAMERTLKRFMAGLAAEAKLASMEARTQATVQAARKAGREEAQAGKQAKVNSTRTQAARVNTVSPNLQSAPQAPKSTGSFIRELAASRASQTWE